MEAYLITAPGKPPQFMTVGTDAQRSARESNGTCESAIIPDTKRELVPWINELVASAVAEARADVLRNRSPLRPEAVDRIAASPAMNPHDDERPPESLRHTSAVATMARMDGGRQVDEIVEAIAVSKGYPLIRYAGAVAAAFKRLAGED